jgi:adenosine deaminase
MCALAVQRMDHVGVAVDDLAAAAEFFDEVGLAPDWILVELAEEPGSADEPGRSSIGARTEVPRVLTTDTIRRAPKALLHDHLDGGLRPATIIDLAREYGYRGLPTEDVDDLSAWFRRGADRKSLELYLETFQHTVGVMQHPGAIARVAAECAEDLAADGVVYAEVRFAPELSVQAGLTPDEVVRAVLEGYRIGMVNAARAGHPIVVRGLVTAMRQAARSMEIADLALRWRDDGVVGFDIAGPEAGYRPTRHLDAFEHLRRENFHITIHAGESFGLPSIWEALQICGAERLGHGLRIIDDITIEPDGTARLGRLASFVRDTRVPLEMCPTSNVQTGGVGAFPEHPIDLLRRLRFRVTVNTDNRLMSGVSASSEFHALDEAFGIDLAEMRWLTINAIKSSFIPFDERLMLIDEVVKPGYARLHAEAEAPTSTAGVPAG